MSQLQHRIERLEQRGASETGLMVVIGEPSAEQRATIDQGQARVIIWMPDNGRDGNDRNQGKA